MTSNLGSNIQTDGLGFQPQGRQGELDSALRQHFSPEFLGRIDKIVRFAPLDTKAVEEIVNKYLRQLLQRTEAAGVRLQLPEDTAAKLGSACGKKDGARQLRRLVQDRVEGPLAVYLLKNPRKAVKVKAVWEQDVLQFQ